MRKMITTLALIGAVLAPAAPSAACPAHHRRPSYAHAWRHCRAHHGHDYCVDRVADLVAQGKVTAPRAR